MDDETRWQDAAQHDDRELIGPPKPETETGDTTGYDDLETGIASIFAALHAAGPAASDLPTPRTDEPADRFEDAHTFQLLGELDRLWQRASP